MERFGGDARDTADGLGAREATSGRPIVDEVQTVIQEFVARRKEAWAGQIDAVAAECVRVAQNLERTQPSTAALARALGVRLGNVAESLDERSPGELARGLARGFGANPAVFVGGLVGGAALARFVLRSGRRSRR